MRSPALPLSFREAMRRLRIGNFHCFEKWGQGCAPVLISRSGRDPRISLIRGVMHESGDRGKSFVTPSRERLSRLRRRGWRLQGLWKGTNQVLRRSPKIRARARSPPSVEIFWPRILVLDELRSGSRRTIRRIREVPMLPADPHKSPKELFAFFRRTRDSFLAGAREEGLVVSQLWKGTFRLVRRSEWQPQVSFRLSPPLVLPFCSAVFSPPPFSRPPFAVCPPSPSSVPLPFSLSSGLGSSSEHRP